MACIYLRCLVAVAFSARASTGTTGLKDIGENTLHLGFFLQNSTETKYFKDKNGSDLIPDIGKCVY